ncbi:MAG: hypothetical protein RR923_03015 [Bacilli bacterium]
MKKFTQEYYDILMEYIGLNQRSIMLLSTTKYTGFVRWHNRNHEIYDNLNNKITKYISNMYGEYSTTKPITTYNYAMPTNIISHIDSWIGILESMKNTSYELYEMACNESDLVLAGYFKKLNKMVINEIFQLKRLLKRFKDATQTDISYVNKIIHDYFEKNKKCKWIDLSL